MQPDAQFSTAGLPKAFLHSMRTLFDILDDGRRGYVHISEIESRWRGAETPPGVLESLRRIAPHHGCLTFERFVSGLRNSMLNPKNSSRTAASKPPHDSTECKVRPLGPSNAINTQRSRQMSRDRLHGVSVGGFDRAACSVRMGKKPLHSSRTRAIESLALESPNGQKAHESAGLPRSQSETVTGFTRRYGKNQDEQRRHTLTNGVDYGMLKQMKELEQEKDSLLAGLDVLDRAREWYQTQIHNVIETQRHVGQSHSTASSTGSCPSRLDVLLPKLQDVTRCLSDLISFSATTFPSAVVSPPASVPAPPQAIQVIKEQNRLLTQEVSEKSDRITQLEQEKSALIKQLFEARARNTHDSSVLDSTFI
ncbi:suppressor APC domain-containing protein 2 [Triplophysa rosa]|uniref:suppressor APC domain-containing protein 2 n=1 Tax=Triplophysa rosa TaxID=992332 RepID=UPI002546202E|nr:suppressor APC domain-containing protein 2 [Triplophysa rosa]